MTTIELDDELRDALGETFNMALGEASVQFAELVNEEIELTVPMVELVPRSALVAAIEATGYGEAPSMLCRIAPHFPLNAMWAR